MAAKRQATGPQVLHFLDEHSLAHSPANYEFGYRFLTEQDTSLKAEVERIIDGGVRIGPDEVARLVDEWHTDPSIDPAVAPQLDGLTLRVLTIIGEVTDATGDLNRDLVSAAASLTDGASVRSIVSAMIERTSLAEASLAEATRKAESLRVELNALRNRTNRDRLTGLLNRAGIEEQLAVGVASPKGCTIAMVELDGLKMLNETHGRAVGDRLLRVVAMELAESCRPHVVARWSGEGFLVVIPERVASEALAIIDAARSRIAGRRLKVRETDAELGTITLSAGILSSRGRSLAQLVASAEALLVRARSGGGDRVEVEPAAVEVTPGPQGNLA